MTANPTCTLDRNDLSEIRDAVPTLDLLAIRSLRRAGFDIVKAREEDEPKAPMHPHWRMTTSPVA